MEPRNKLAGRIGYLGRLDRLDTRLATLARTQVKKYAQLCAIVALLFAITFITGR
jgi:hypothetical protein